MGIGRFSSAFKSQARKFRQEQTKAESLAWKQLRNRGILGLKFRRQVPVDRYIADFYCDELRTIIELDGEVHGEPGPAVRDEERDRRLRELGYRVIRIPNEALREEDSDVLEETLRGLLPPSPPGRGQRA